MIPEHDPGAVPSVQVLLQELEHVVLRRDAREILAVVLDVTPAEIAGGRVPDAALTPELAERARSAASDIAVGKPFAYAVGSAAFRHLVLRVDSRVLIPRPETEIVVEHALRLTRDRDGGIAVDIGTGSGAIALSLAQEGSFARVIGTDISADALDVARNNTRAMNGAEHRPPLKADVEWRLGSDLSPFRGERARLIVSNPPYIAYHEAPALPASVRDWEPPSALFAANDGMARYAAIVRGAERVLEPGGWLVFECDSRRAQRVAELMHAHAGFTDVAVLQDLAKRDRVCVARWTA